MTSRPSRTRSPPRLRYEGFVTSEVASGREAIRAAEEFGPDLVILDIMLPDLDGLSIARKLRALPAHVPVIFLSARDGTDDKVAGLSLARRLRREAVQPRGAGRAGARRAAAHGAADTGNVLRFADVELDDDAYEVSRAGERSRADADRVLAPALPAAEPAPRAVEAADPRPRVAVRLRRRRRTSSRPTCRTCAASSTGTARRSSTRCAWSGTFCGRPDALRSLRTRLVAITTLLAAIGLIVAGIATYAALRSFLLERVDRTLAASTSASAGQLTRGGPRPRPSGLGALGQAGPLTPGLLRRGA